MGFSSADAMSSIMNELRSPDARQRLDLLRDAASQIWLNAVPKSHWDIAALLVFSIVVAGLVSKPWDIRDPYEYVFYEIPQQKKAGGGKSKAKASRNIAERLELLNKDAVIFWGSQSGTAQTFAARLERELLSRFSFNTLAADLSDYDAESIANIPATRTAIFIMSTFGEGDPSDNAVDYLGWLKNAGPQSLSNLRYAAFGLGDSNYLHFNNVIIAATQMMDELGATAVLPLGKADAAIEGATEEHFTAWKTELIALLQNTFGLQEKPPVYVPQLEVVDDDSLDIQDLNLGVPVHSDGNKNTKVSPIVELLICSDRELFDQSATSRSCIHMEFDITDLPQVQYKTGDYVSIWPSNPDNEVETLLSVLGMETVRDVPILIKPLDGQAKLLVPTPTTRKALFEHYLEISAPVTQDTLLQLVQLAPGAKARSFLQLLGSDKARFDQFSRQAHVTLGRLLQYAAREEGETCSWSKLPLSFVIEALPVLRPRLYSISSSNVIAPRNPTLTALVVQTPLAEKPDEFLPGLASSYLKSLCQNRQKAHGSERRTVHAAFRKSKFHPPASPAIPIIMIAAGSGIAPFRGFVLERARLAQMKQKVGKTVLFFGCRHPSQDFVYREELEGALATLPDAELAPVFSRLEEINGQPRYVQDLLRARGEELAELILDQGARVYVCGRAAMGREVAAAIREAVTARNPEFQDEAARMQWWDRWRRAGGFSEDVWG
ncbi:nadph-cytochrome p450 reductase [Ophiostoma piceae UAMH 11346]|uniref:Nadph-cytochrome p450 reductase n=1 Tax=Ophiostoma piceae (strain UAMH 11346) TaxID=1262450 RepID=S3CQL2_OPHP1|nr:nadph-cytochrome p450 reductase [Ophiostoma piceae UAMH 11346]